MQFTVPLELDTRFIVKTPDIRGMIEHGYPFVLYFDNIMSYIDGVNPKISHDPAIITKASKSWDKIKSLVTSFSTTSEVSTKLYVLGIYNKNTLLVSDIIPRLPKVPKYLGIIEKGNMLFINRSNIGNMRRIYITILKNLIKGVIVKTTY